ncbi:MAG: hypothetical protein IT311_00330 [Anaerolineales bacterium]|nr:hypothetical protein [Anaerolineales bacterium]MCZ2121221.1 hypothetical protein [Anaerolineales bacterium]
MLCVVGIFGIIAIMLFVYLLNTARKKTPPPSAATSIKDYAPVYVSIADKPNSILRGMDQFAKDLRKTESAGDKWRWIPMIIFLIGVGLLGIDLIVDLLGYFSITFTGGALALWIAAFVMARNLRRSDSKDFSPRYQGTKEIIRSLRDDLKPDSTFLGHLDLTGATLKTKVARETKDTQGRTTQMFNDEWLSLKAKLYDGNVLRLAATQRTKKRMSYWKRSRISGKSKLKPEKFKGTEQRLKVRIVVNPEAYTIVPNATFRQGQNIGKYTITALDTQGGMINILADSPFAEIEQENILNFLKSSYSLLQRKAV